MGIRGRSWSSGVPLGEAGDPLTSRRPSKVVEEARPKVGFFRCAHEARGYISASFREPHPPSPPGDP